MKAAIYARRASITQQDQSTDVQIRLCQEYVERHGGMTVATYSDDGFSGLHLETRPSLQRLLEDAKTGLFDTVITEGLDCLSRDPAGIATIFKSLTHNNITSYTLEEGAISERDVGSTGTMNPLHLRRLAIKVRRGQEGQAKAGWDSADLRGSHEAERELGCK
ncbi:recombinase family protein [Azospirillum sp. 412522]|nr:recombinase family protein [Azospirillum sp. 412522]MBY6262132.1 recombinase family protein [Azospirillum sp. 412522]